MRNTANFRVETPTIVTIGTFDGVHKGHQKILSRLSQLSEATGLRTTVLTFDPHPRHVLSPRQDDVKLLTTTDEKLELLERYGVDVAVVYPFTKEFAQMPPIDYIRDILVRSLKVSHLVIGYDHHFGAERKGNIHTLREHAHTFGYHVEEISALDIDHIAISSSKIRKSLEEGNIALAEKYLGHPFTIKAPVAEGKRLGRTIGYPTANLAPESDKLLPANGVYFVFADTPVGEYYGMMSIGTNPTTDTDGAVKVEVHLFDFDENLYGSEIKITFLKRLRDELKFDGLEALRAALDADKSTCMKLIETEWTT